MTVIRAALDEMFAVIGQMVGSVFRHGLPLTDKIAARTALTNFFLHIHPVRVRRSWIRMSYTLCLGGLSFFLFIVLTVTGLFLMFYYVPSTSHAYQDMRDLQFVVTFGGVIRNMHRWAAHAMVITVWLHMARVFLTGSYKKPREFNWGVGTLLLLITLLLSFTGYLLPWDQLSIWAVAMTAFLILVSVWLQAPLLGQANPGMTPNPSKAPWYFLGLQELLSRFPPLMAGVAFPTFVIVLMILVPFLDRNPSRRPSERKVAIILFALYMAIVVALVIIGTFFRGHEFIWNWGWVLGNPQTCGGAAC